MPMFYPQAHSDRPLYSNPSAAAKRNDNQESSGKRIFLVNSKQKSKSPNLAVDYVPETSSDAMFGMGPLSRDGPSLTPAVGRIFLVETDAADVRHLPMFRDMCVFSTPEDIVYYPFREDFGPFNLSMVYKFCRIFSKVLSDEPDKQVAFCGGSTSKRFTNSTFLLGAYLILEQGWSPRKVATQLHELTTRCEAYCDITKCPSNFGLNLEDCWAGLAQAKELGWCGTRTASKIDMESYEHYDDPGNGDLHEVVPGKLIAFKGPRSDIDHWWVDVDGIRHFQPVYFHDIFDELNVDCVIRLNAAQYSAEEFECVGIKNIDLEFADGCAPPLRVVEEFLREVEATERVAAVHCQAGLGRTGTLIALYLMKHHNFTARAAIGWTRIVRPGSISGEQQHFLCKMEMEWLPGQNLGGGRATASSRTSSGSSSCSSRTSSNASQLR
eukprot:2558062-Rhodomonas_salina.1